MDKVTASLRIKHDLSSCFFPQSPALWLCLSFCETGDKWDSDTFCSSVHSLPCFKCIACALHLISKSVCRSQLLNHERWKDKYLLQTSRRVRTRAFIVDHKAAGLFRNLYCKRYIFNFYFKSYCNM